MGLQVQNLISTIVPPGEASAQGGALSVDLTQTGGIRLILSKLCFSIPAKTGSRSHCQKGSFFQGGDSR